MNKVTRLDITLLGERNYPHATARIPEAMISELPHLVEIAQELNPATTAEDVLKAIIRCGIRSLRNSLQAGEPVDLAKLPGLQPPIKLAKRGPVKFNLNVEVVRGSSGETAGPESAPRAAGGGAGDGEGNAGPVQREG